MHKKVGSITLEYALSDGTIVSEAFDAEFQDARITGDISALEGTFSGKLDVNALDVFKNIHIAGRSVAITTIATLPLANSSTHGFNDDGVFRTLISNVIEVPEGMNGAWCVFKAQYTIDDQKDDNGGFLCQSRLIIDGDVYYQTSKVSWWMFYYDQHQHSAEMAIYLTGSGFHTIAIQYAWFSQSTNVYPRFSNIIMRSDVILK